MRKIIIVGLAALLIVLIIGGYIVWSTYVCVPSMTQVRNITMTYIKSHHQETAQYMENLSWTGGNITPVDFTGGQWYSYLSAGWNVTIQYPVALPPGSMTIYSLTATYSAQAASGEPIVSWQGTLENGVITQTAYTFNSNP